MAECMLTTFDNPFDPFEQFTSWYLFDVEKGYNTCGRLMRIAKISDDMSSKEIDDELNRAIDDIIKYDIFNIYTRAWSNSENNTTMETESIGEGV